MTQRITRRDMKRNELAETVGKTVDYVSGHRKGVAESVAIAAGLAVLVVGVLRVPHVGGPVGRTEPLRGPRDPLDAPRDRAAERRQDVSERGRARQAEAEPFLRKAAARGSTPSGRAAQVILAAAGSQKPGQAVEAFENAAREGPLRERSPLPRSTRRSCSPPHGKTDRGDRPAEARDRVRYDRRPQGRPALHARPDLRASGAAADARATYQRLITDYPNSPYRADARQKVPLS